MRLSVDRRDPAFHPAGSDDGVMVLLDGDPQRLALTADEERGYIICLVPDDRGEVHPNANGMVATRIKFGRVRIIIPPHLQGVLR